MWSSKSVHYFHTTSVDYIEMFYNSTRRHSYLGYLSPAEFEKGMVLKKAA